MLLFGNSLSVDTYTGQTRLRIFALDGPNDAESHTIKMFVRSLVDIAPHLGGHIPKNLFAGVNKHFKAKPAKN